MSDLFKEIVPSILQTKKYTYSQETYKPFVVNKALSYHMDCIMYANQMNMSATTDSELQYQYLLNTIRAMKRKFQPWQKAQSIEDLDYVKEYYGYSNAKAKEALRILNKDQISLIKEKLDKGGVKNNDKNRRSG
jgi:cellobiose phosphorylase